MNRNFKFKAADKPDPVYFEQIFAEKPGGGILANPDFDVLKSTAVGKNAEGKLVPIKAYRLVEAADADATSIKIAKGSGVKEGHSRHRQNRCSLHQGGHRDLRGL